MAVALARKCIGGRLGLNIDLSKIPTDEDLSIQAKLFSESNSRFIVTVQPDHQAEFEAIMAGQPCALVGKVKRRPVLVLNDGDDELFNIEIDEMLDAFKSGLK